MVVTQFHLEVNLLQENCVHVNETDCRQKKGLKFEGMGLNDFQLEAHKIH